MTDTFPFEGMAASASFQEMRSCTGMNKDGRCVWQQTCSTSLCNPFAAVFDCLPPPSSTAAPPLPRACSLFWASGYVLLES